MAKWTKAMTDEELAEIREAVSKALGSTPHAIEFKRDCVAVCFRLLDEIARLKLALELMAHRCGFTGERGLNTTM